MIKGEVMWWGDLRYQVRDVNRVCEQGFGTVIFDYFRFRRLGLHRENRRGRGPFFKICLRLYL